MPCTPSTARSARDIRGRAVPGPLSQGHPITTIGIIGAGQVGSHLARTAVRHGFQIVIAKSRGPDTLRDLIRQLGPRAQAATAEEAARAGDFVTLAVRMQLVNDMPTEALAGKIVLDTNNYMPWRDGSYPMIDAGLTTEHEIRQAQLPRSKIAKAFTHIQAPRLLTYPRPPGAPDREALSVFSDHPEATALVMALYETFGFDAVDAGPLSQSWRTWPGQPVWKASGRQGRALLVSNLAKARRS